MDKVVVRQLVRDTARYTNQEVQISGWIRTNRDQKSFGFITLNDGTHFNTIQVVYEKESLPNFEEVAKFRVGAAVTIQGLLVETPQANKLLRSKPGKLFWKGTARRIIPFSPSGIPGSF